MVASRSLAAGNTEYAAYQAQVGVCSNHIQVVGLNSRLPPNLGHWHAGGLRKQIREHALVPGLQVLHQNERHPGVPWKRTEKLYESLQPACGGADADDYGSAAAVTSFA